MDIYFYDKCQNATVQQIESSFDEWIGDSLDNSEMRLYSKYL